MNHPFLFSFLFVLLWLAWPHSSFAQKQENLPIQILHQDGTLLSEFSLPIDNAGGGGDIVVADLGTDGTAELIVANGLGNEPWIRVLRQDGSLVGTFLAYEKEMTSGMHLAVCDANHDGLSEIIVAPQYGGMPLVRIFSHMGELLSEHFVYAEGFRGGVNLACDDLDGNGINEIVTGAGPGGGPHVRIWELEAEKWKLKNDFFAFKKEDRRGILVAINNKTLTITSQQGPIADMALFINDSITSRSTYQHNTSGLVDMHLLQNKKTLFTSSENKTIFSSEKILLSGPSLFGGIRMDAEDLDHDGKEELIAISGRPLFGREDTQYIRVDLSDQRLFAYEQGRLAKSFLVSTGLRNSTPLGMHSVLAKIPYVHYRWFYGPNNPSNYDLGLVQYNLRFYPHIYIHYAYWHDNFGYPMSHGCVNVNFENMKWIYKWAQEGIPVEIAT